MRPQSRIYPMVTKLLRYWEDHPDLRLGQIIVNAEAKAGKKCDLFFIEDEDLINGLEKLKHID